VGNGFWEGGVDEESGDGACPVFDIYREYTVRNPIARIMISKTSSSQPLTGAVMETKKFMRLTNSSHGFSHLCAGAGACAA
jgi:hypothetical protein